MGQGTNAAQGALGGGMTGAAIGTAVMPGLGTLVGGGLGALAGGAAGWFGDDGEDDQLKQYREQLAAMSGYNAPQLGNPAVAYLQNGQLGQSMGLMQSMALGNGPSAATVAAQNAMQQSAANQQALAAGVATRGVSPGAAYRNAANMTAGVDQNTLAALAQARAQEQMSAISGYGQLSFNAANMANETERFNAQQYNQFAVERERAIQEERRRQLMALQYASGVDPKTGPSMGEQLLAGGAGAFSMIPQLRAFAGGGKAAPGGDGVTWSGGTATRKVT